MPQPQLPATIGRYRVERLIGQGAMGEVYLAVDGRIGRRVAIKTLRLSRVESASELQAAGELFLREARICGKLNHPNIIAIYDMGMDHGLPYLVMEYFPGRDLKQVMAAGDDLSLARKVRIIAAIARALHYAHQRGVLHRDIKPANILLSEQGFPKLTDFGIAALMGRTLRPDAENEERVVLGSPHYMSPEHLKGRGFGPQTDIFSLGIVAYEWISGTRPFTGADKAALSAAIVGQREADLARCPGVDSELAAIIHQALKKSPPERQQSAERLSDALEIYLNRCEQQGSREKQVFDKQQIIRRLKKKYVFFADFTDDELLTIFRLARLRHYIEGEYLIREGGIGTQFYIIISGKVSVSNESDGREIELERLGAGGCVGEMALVDKQARSASVKALEPTSAIAINETVLRLSEPGICLKLYRNLACLLSERLRQHDARYKAMMAAGSHPNHHATKEEE